MTRAIIIATPIFLLTFIVIGTFKNDMDEGQTEHPRDEMADESSKPGEPQHQVAFLLANNGFWGPDYHKIAPLLKQAGITVVVASPKVGFCVPANGGDKATAHISIRELDVSRCSAVVVAGGVGRDELMKPSVYASDVKAVLQCMVSNGGLVGAVGDGTVVVGDAGVLEGRRVTCHKKQTRFLQLCGATVKPDEPFVIDGPIVTARSAADAKDFAEILIARITTMGNGLGDDRANNASQSFRLGGEVLVALIGAFALIAAAILGRSRLINTIAVDLAAKKSRLNADAHSGSHNATAPSSKDDSGTNNQDQNEDLSVQLSPDQP